MKICEDIGTNKSNVATQFAKLQSRDSRFVSLQFQDAKLCTALPVCEFIIADNVVKAITETSENNFKTFFYTIKKELSFST